MARKNYTEEFRRQAVDLYRSTRVPRCEGSPRIWGSPGTPCRLGARAGRRRTVEPRVRRRAAPGRRRDPAGRAGRARPGSAEAELAALRARVAALETENADSSGHRAGHPAPGGQVFRRGDALVSRFQFVADHRHAFEVKRLCEIVEVARSSFYAWLDAAPAPRRPGGGGRRAGRADPHDPRQDRTQGAPRITAELNDGAPPDRRVNHKRVARVMRAHAIAGLRLAAGCAPPSRSRPTRRSPTCSAATSPPTRRTGATSGTSPTCRSPTAQPVPGHGDRLLLPAAGRVGGRRAHAHRPGRRRATAARATRGSLAGAIFHSDYADLG